MLKKKDEKNPALEYPDPTPVEIPTELKRPESIDEKMKRIIRNELSVQAQARGRESFEEANDFNVEDSFEADGVLSPYEVNEMVEEFPVEEKVPEIGSSRQNPEKGQVGDEGRPALKKLMEEYTKDQLVDALIEMEKKNDRKIDENGVDSDR